MNFKRSITSVLASVLFILSLATPAFAEYYNDTSTYITGYSYVNPTYLNPYSLPQNLDVNKQTQLRSGYSPSNIVKSLDGTPNYKTTSTPQYGTTGWNFSGNWSTLESHSMGHLENGFYL